MAVMRRERERRDRAGNAARGFLAKHRHPIFDPLGFLHFGRWAGRMKTWQTWAGLSVERRPRARPVPVLGEAPRPIGRTWRQPQSISCGRRSSGAHAPIIARRGFCCAGIDHRGGGARSSDANYVVLSRRRCPALPEMLFRRGRLSKPGDVRCCATDGLWQISETDFIPLAQVVGKTLRDL